MILGDCEETVTTIEIDEETYEEVMFWTFYILYLKLYVNEIFLTPFFSNFSCMFLNPNIFFQFEF